MKLSLFTLFILIFKNYAISTDHPPSTPSPVHHQPYPGQCSVLEFKHLKDGQCYPKLFMPTSQFQPILEGQLIPEGLHVQVNLATGEKMAKLLEGSASTGAIVAFSEEPLGHKGNRQAQIRTLDPLQPVPLEDLSDQQKAAHFIKVISLPNSLEVDVLKALGGLLEVANDYEIGSAIFKSKHFSSLLGLLNQPSELRILTASVLGAALQNNGNAQKEAHRWGLTDKLLYAIRNESATKPLDRMLFALSALVRGNPMGLEAFYRSEGDRILLEAYLKSQDPSIRRRLLTLMIDIVDPSLQPEGPEGADEHISLFNRLDPNLKASISEWCEVLQVETSRALSDLALEAIAELSKTFPESCHSQPPVDTHA